MASKLAVLVGFVGVLVAGCPGEADPTDGAQPVEQGLGELGFPDGPGGDGTSTDGPASDGPVHDGPVTDGPQADGPTSDGPAVGDGPLPADQGPKSDGLKVCAGDVDCKAFEDCCKCNAIFTWQNMAACKMACTDKACTAKLNLALPVAYCVTGRCFLGDGTACSSDADCKLVNDCCNCLALPTSNVTPSCSISTCLVSTCTASQVPSAQAKCVSGTCRLVP